MKKTPCITCILVYLYSRITCILVSLYPHITCILVYLYPCITCILVYLYTCITCSVYLLGYVMSVAEDLWPFTIRICTLSFYSLCNLGCTLYNVKMHFNLVESRPVKMANIIEVQFVSVYLLLVYLYTCCLCNFNLFLAGI